MELLFQWDKIFFPVYRCANECCTVFDSTDEMLRVKLRESERKREKKIGFDKCFDNGMEKKYMCEFGWNRSYSFFFFLFFFVFVVMNLAAPVELVRSCTHHHQPDSVTLFIYGFM